MATEERTGSSIFAGVAAGLVMGCLAGGGAAFVVKQRMVHAANDWHLRPVVVAAVDIDEGTTLTFDMISQRSVPGLFVTDSMVFPDSASYVVNESVHAPLKAGEVLLWPEFEHDPCDDAVEQLAHAKPDSKDLAAWLAQLRAGSKKAHH